MEDSESFMDCYFHSNVPSMARCADCSKPICATCRDERGTCPSCRLAAKVEAATATRQQIAGAVPPRPAPASVRGRVAVAEAQDPVESRALVSLGYPLWPLALLSLLDRKQSRKLRRQALQALGFNLGFQLSIGLDSFSRVFGINRFVNGGGNGSSGRRRNRFDLFN